MSQYRLILAYDGTAYQGWQDNKEHHSVEAVLREVLERILQEKLKLEGCSRTDTGVHALGQVVTFSTEQDLALSEIFLSCNALLPPDIRVRSIEPTPDDFHPSLSCESKVYQYRICTSPVLLPLQRHDHWHYPYPLDLLAMKGAAKELLGTHDFSAFCNRHKEFDPEDTVRTLHRINIAAEEEGCWRIEMEGNSFLYKMARNIAGTLAQIGRGQLDENCIAQALESGDRTQAGMTAPALGLTLHSVKYKKPDRS